MTWFVDQQTKRGHQQRGKGYPTQQRKRRGMPRKSGDGGLLWARTKNGGRPARSFGYEIYTAMYVANARQRAHSASSTTSVASNLYRRSVLPDGADPPCLSLGTLTKTLSWMKKASTDSKRTYSCLVLPFLPSSDARIFLGSDDALVVVRLSCTVCRAVTIPIPGK
jgi:hypothetical protein